MMTPLPSVDITRSIVKEEGDVFSMFNKRGEQSCGNCGKVGHTIEKCWLAKLVGRQGTHMINARQ